MAEYAFCLFVYDVYSPWLLEVNLSPSLAFESPLDLKIKGNLIKDTLNLVGLKKPFANDGNTKGPSSQAQSGNGQPASHLVGYHSSVGGPNNFFKGKMSGKVPKKGEVEYRLKMAANILTEQVDAMPEELFNIEQKDYVKSFITMPAKMKEIVIETMLEHQRRGNFVRIYPTKNSDYYDCFLS